MVPIAVPEIFYKGWFWWVILLGFVVVVYFVRKKHPPAPPKPSKFYNKHKKSIAKILDVFLIIIVVLGWVPILYMSLSIAVEPIFNPSYRPEMRVESFRTALAFFLIPAIPLSSVSSVLIGILSVFQSNLTKVKRIILLIICLLPSVFTIIALLIEPTDKPWSLIKLGLIYSCICWVINGPAIITGKHFFRVWWAIMRALRLVSGEYPG